MSIPAAFWLALAAAVTPAVAPPGSPSAVARRPAPAVAEATRVRVDRQHTIQVSNTSPFYEPSRLTVRAGETVRWRNGPSSDRHSVRETAHGTFSLEIPPGEEASFRFARPGEFHYQCRFHPWMHGTIVVEPSRLAVAWQPLPAHLRGARLLAGNDGSVLLVGTGSRPLVARGTAEGVVAVGTLDRPVLPDVRPGLGRDGTLWFAGETPGTLVSFSLANATTSLHRPAAGEGVWTALAAAPDGGVWLHDLASRRLGRFEPATGATVWHPAPDLEHPLVAMRVGADGLAWMLDAESRKVLRLDRQGLRVELTVPMKIGTLRGLTAAAGGVWLTSEEGRIARLVDGRIEEVDVSPPAGQLSDVAGGEGSGLWFLDAAGPRLGHAADDALGAPR